MDQVKSRYLLQCKIVLYLFPCLAASWVGAFAIGIGTNELQTWYNHKYAVRNPSSGSAYEIYYDSDGILHYDFWEESIYEKKIWYIISYAQVVLIPLWILGCIILGGNIFYRRELKKPLLILRYASEQIAQNKLDFSVKYEKKGELGELCAAFEKMRLALWENNQSTWRLLEERKRLNAAFSHDLRTPLTIVRGYTDFLQKYAADGAITRGKQMEILGMMDRQIGRLQKYVEKMNTVQRIEDAQPYRSPVKIDEIKRELIETGKLLREEKQFFIDFSGKDDEKVICIDSSLVMEVYENLLSNSVRYADRKIMVFCRIEDEYLKIKVKDDGKGFSQEILSNLPSPFFHEKNELPSGQTHLGMGLYICKIICEKCMGGLILENEEGGAAATAFFYIK